MKFLEKFTSKKQEPLKENQEYGSKVNVKHNLAKVFKKLTSNPEVINQADEFALSKGANLVSFIWSLSGTRAEVISLAGSYKKYGGLPNLVRNGLVEEILNVEEANLTRMLFVASESDGLVELLGSKPLTDSEKGFFQAHMIPIITKTHSLIAELKKNDPDFVGKLSIDLAKFIEIRDDKKEETLNQEKWEDKEIELIRNMSNNCINALQKLDPQKREEAIKEIAIFFSSALDYQGRSNRVIGKDDKFKKMFAKIYESINPPKGVTVSEFFVNSNNILQRIIESEGLDKLVDNAIKYQLQEKNKQENYSALVSSGLELLTSEKVLDALFNKKNIQELAIKLKVSEDLLPDIPNLVDFARNAAGKLLENNEDLVKIIVARNNLLEKNTQENKLQLFGAISNLAKNQDLINSLVEDKNLEIFLKKTNIFKEEISDFKSAIKKLIPSLSNLTEKAYKDISQDKELDDLVLLTQQIVNSESENKSEELTKKAVSILNILSVKPELLNKFNTLLAQDKENLQNIIDESLFSIKKNDNKLKLLKPMGINGSFIVKMIEKISTPQGLVALSKCIEQPNFSNVYNLLKETKSLSFVASHIFKSLGKFAVMKTIKYFDNSNSTQKSWVHNVRYNVQKKIGNYTKSL
jgi:hypothetical protein